MKIAPAVLATLLVLLSGIRVEANRGGTAFRRYTHLVPGEGAGRQVDDLDPPAVTPLQDKIEPPPSHNDVGLTAWLRQETHGILEAVRRYAANGVWVLEPGDTSAHAIPIPSRRRQMYFRPVSTTLHCVMVLTIASLILHTSLSIARNVDELGGNFQPSLVTQTLTAASRGAALPPMMCMLFVGCRMYVLATTEGLGEPPSWVKTCMCIATCGIVMQYLFVLFLPVAVEHENTTEIAPQVCQAPAKGKAEEVTEGKPAETPREPEEVAEFHEVTGEQNDVHPALRDLEFKETFKVARPGFWAMQIGSMVFIYGGVIGIVVGIITFPAQSTAVSPAVICTVVLGFLYFLVYMFLWIARSMEESAQQERLLNAALSMSSVSRKAPMFAILFLMSRMRALQLDPPHGMPPQWMQSHFFAITGMVMVEAIAALVVGLQGRKARAYYGVYTFHAQNKAGHAVQHTAALLTYLALFPIIWGAYTMLDKEGLEVPLSTTMRCLIVLEAVYFGVMFAQTAVFGLKDLLSKDFPITQDTFVSAGISLSFAPLLCVLFVATRLRALQITQQQGDPPGWSQDCMLCCVFATCVQGVCCLVMPIFIGSSCKVDEDGNPDYDLRPMVGAYAVTVVKYVALLMLHGSVFTICVAVFMMTPESANSSGRFLQGGRSLLTGLFVAVMIFFLALLFSSAKVVGMAIKLGIESVDKVLLGVDIEIEKAALSVCKAYVHIKNLEVKQPEDEMVWERDETGKMVGRPTGKKLEWRHDYILRIHTVLVKINVWRLIKTFGREFELENLSFTGVHANVEKPSTNLKVPDTNVEYIVNHLDSLGLIPKEEQSDDKVAKERHDHKPAPSKTQEKPTTSTDALPNVIIHKIAFGDIGCGVTVEKVPVLGTLSFHPAIGTLLFEDVQKDIFKGREDTKPTEVVVRLVLAVVQKICASVLIDIPKHVTKATGDAAIKAASKSYDAMKSLGSGMASKLGFGRSSPEKEKEKEPATPPPTS